MSVVFTPGQSVRRDGGPTGEFAAVAASPIGAEDGDARTQATAPDPEVMDPVDFELRYPMEGAPRERDGETVCVCQDVLQDAMPQVVVQRLMAPSSARVRQIGMRAAIRHPDVAGVLGLYRVGDELAVVFERASDERLDAWVDVDGPFPRVVAIRLVDRLAAAVEALHAASLTGLGLDPSRVGLRWREPGAAEPVLVDLGEPTEGGVADDVAALAEVLAYTLTGEPGGRPALAGKALRAFLDRARHVDPSKRPADVGAFRRELGALTDPDAARGWRRAGVIGVITLVAALAGMGAWWYHQRPPLAPPLPPMTLQLSAANDTAAAPMPPVRIAPLDAGYGERVGQIDQLLRERAGARADLKVDRDILARLGDALAGRPATIADRERVGQIALAGWYAREAASASAALGRAIDAGRQDDVTVALHALYALDPTHPGAAFAVRNRQALRLIMEDR